VRVLTLLAHAAPVTYKFPLPIWLYVCAGGAAVLLSAPAAAIAVTDVPRRERRSRPLTFPSWLRAVGLTVTTALFVIALVGGLFASGDEATEFFENPMTVLTWVDLWVGLGIVSLLVGYVWDFVSPLSAAARVVDRALARRDVEPLRYPERLGQWPAIGLLLVWTWMELIWERAKDPRTLALMVIAYCIATLLGSALFGAATWLGHAEFLTVLSRAFARFGMIELRPPDPDDWLATAPEERIVRLRPHGAGLRTDPPLPAGGGAFVLTALATVVFDGWSQTDRFGSFQQWFYERWSFLAEHVNVLQTLSLLAVVVIFVVAYVVVVGGSARELAPTLIPIAAVYFAAHYFAYLLIAGQYTLGVIVDSLAKGWNPLGFGEYEIWKGIAPAALVWWAQVLLIVWGHVVAVSAAHRLALRRRPSPARALVAHTPLVMLMVCYTVAGLWVLAQQIKAT
jgi:hypothetical protein